MSDSALPNSPPASPTSTVDREFSTGGSPERTADRLKSPYSRSIKIKRLIWSAVESTLFRGSFHTMSGWRSMLLRMFGAKIGRKCIIRRTVRTYYPWNLTVGDMCIIGDRAELYSLDKITIGDRAMISQESYLCAGSHDYTDIALPVVTMPITVGAEAWVCARAFVGPGVTVGPGAVVAACAVALKDVEPWMIVAGNPAKIVKKRELQSDSASE